MSAMNENSFVMSEAQVGAWYSKLPADLQQVIAQGSEPEPGEAARLYAAIGAVEPEMAFDVVCKDVAGVRGMGRVGRMRFLAWLLNENPSQAERLVHREEDDEEGSTGVPGDIVDLFRDGFDALLRDCVGPRLAMIVTQPGLDIGVEAAVILESDLTFTQGGM